MFDMSRLGEMDIRKLGLEAACDKAYNAGLADAEGRMKFMMTMARAAGFAEGMDAGFDAFQASFLEASTVKAVFRSGDYTVLETADGEKTKVKYDPSYGYAYDAEKAYMAALLKHIVGNRYIDMLRELCLASAPKHGRDMIQRGVSVVQDPDDDWRDFLNALGDDESGCNPGTGDVVPCSGPCMMADAFGDTDDTDNAETAPLQDGGADTPGSIDDSGFSDAMPAEDACEPAGTEPPTDDTGDPFPASDASFFQACE